MAVAIFCPAQNLVLFEKTTPTAAPGVTASPLARVNGCSLATGCTSGLHSQNWSTSTLFSTDLTAIEFSLTPDAGLSLNLTSISADLRRSGNLPNHGPTKCRFAYSIDGGATWVFAATDSKPGGTSCSNFATRTWNFPDFTSSTEVQFRIYGFSSSAPAGTLTMRAIKVIGSAN